MFLVVLLQRLCHYFCQKTCDRSLVSHDREGAGCSRPLGSTDLNCQRMQFAVRKLKSKCVHLQITDNIFLIEKYGVFVLSNLKKKPFGFQIFWSDCHTSLNVTMRLNKQFFLLKYSHMFSVIMGFMMKSRSETFFDLPFCLKLKLCLPKVLSYFLCT